MSDVDKLVEWNRDAHARMLISLGRDPEHYFSMHGQTADALKRLSADLAEALKALRELYEAHDIGERDLEPYKRAAIIDDATERARALLVKNGRLPK